MKSIRLFRELCGDDALPNVILCTTMWDIVNPAIGARRLRELRQDFWADMIAEGSRVVRHYNSRRGARKIIRKLMRGSSVALQIQRDVVDEGIDIDDWVESRDVTTQGQYQEEATRLRAEMDEWARQRQVEQERSIQQAREQQLREMEQLQRQVDRQRRELEQKEVEARRLREQAEDSDSDCVIM